MSDRVYLEREHGAIPEQPLPSMHTRPPPAGPSAAASASAASASESSAASASDAERGEQAEHGGVVRREVV